MIIGICDNEAIYVEQIRDHCQKVSHEIKVKFDYCLFHSGEELLAYEGGIDILFLDVELGDANGLTVMRELEKRANVQNILFVSSHPEYVFDSFGEKSRGYLCKPIEHERLVREISAIIARGRERAYVWASYIGEERLLFLDDIMYLSGEDKYVRAYTKDGQYIISGVLKVFEENWRQHSFIRVHKSYLVNMFYIDKIKDASVYLYGGKQLPIGRKYSSVSKEAYKEYLFTKFRNSR